MLLFWLLGPRLATSALCGAEVRDPNTCNINHNKDNITCRTFDGLRKGLAPHNDWEQPGTFKGVPFCDKDLEKFWARNSWNSRLRISFSFSLKLFVLFIKYKTELHFHSIYVPVKDDLSLQEGKLSFWVWDDEPGLGVLHWVGGVWW